MKRARNGYPLLSGSRLDALDARLETFKGWFSLVECLNSDYCRSDRLVQVAVLGRQLPRAQIIDVDADRGYLLRGGLALCPGREEPLEPPLGEVLDEVSYPDDDGVSHRVLSLQMRSSP